MGHKGEPVCGAAGQGRATAEAQFHSAAWYTGADSSSGISLARYSLEFLIMRRAEGERLPPSTVVCAPINKRGLSNGKYWTDPPSQQRRISPFAGRRAENFHKSHPGGLSGERAVFKCNQGNVKLSLWKLLARLIVDCSNMTTSTLIFLSEAD